MTNKQQPKELSPELIKQIEQEAILHTHARSGRSASYKYGFKDGYDAGAGKYALLLQSEQEKRKEAEDALEKIIFEIQNAWEARLGGVITNQHATRLINVVTEFNNYKAKKDGTVNG